MLLLNLPIGFPASLAAHLKTSYVTIKRICGKIRLQAPRNLKTSYVTIKPGTRNKYLENPA